jgi:hypothetical protein
VHGITQLPQRLDRLFRARDDDGIKAEQKARERRGDGPEEEARISFFGAGGGMVGRWHDGCELVVAGKNKER